MKIILKAFFSLLFIFVFSFFELNNTKSLELSVVEIEASTPCFAQAKRNWNYAYIDCASCSRLTGWRAIGSVYTCSSGGSGGSGGGPDPNEQPQS